MLFDKTEKYLFTAFSRNWETEKVYELLSIAVMPYHSENRAELFSNPCVFFWSGYIYPIFHRRCQVAPLHFPLTTKIMWIKGKDSDAQAPIDNIHDLVQGALVLDSQRRWGGCRDS